MRYSVWDKSRGMYRVYQSDRPPAKIVVPITTAGSLGSVPSEVTEKLPEDAEYEGLSETPVGQIVESTGTLFGQFLIAVAAGVLSKLVYDWLMARGGGGP